MEKLKLCSQKVFFFFMLKSVLHIHRQLSWQFKKYRRNIDVEFSSYVTKMLTLISGKGEFIGNTTKHTKSDSIDLLYSISFLS